MVVILDLHANALCTKERVYDNVKRRRLYIL